VTNAVTYVWSLPSGAIIASGQSTNSITVNYASTAVSGNITVQGNNICGNGATSPAFPVTVNQSPPAPLITQLNADSLGSSAPSGNQWYGPGGLISGATGIIYVPTANGDYYDIVTLSGCSSDTSNILNFVLTGINSYTRAPLRIYPNPAFIFIHLEVFLEQPSGITINLMNLTGTNIKTLDLGVHSRGLSRLVVDCNDLREGIYFLKVKTDTGLFVQKVILKK
jgi:hypothetical protein